MAAPGRSSDEDRGSSVAPDGIDEVGVSLGPDEAAGGLFDRTGAPAGGPEPPGVETTASERTLSSVLVAKPPSRRTALLAWIAADLSPPPGGEAGRGRGGRGGAGVPTPHPKAGGDDEPTDIGEFDHAPLRGLARESLAKILSEESLDPLPALDGRAVEPRLQWAEGRSEGRGDPRPHEPNTPVPPLGAPPTGGAPPAEPTGEPAGKGRSGPVEGPPGRSGLRHASAEARRGPAAPEVPTREPPQPDGFGCGLSLVVGGVVLALLLAYLCLAT